ncbi:sensor histidine kinase [Paucilactobacillus nenjiangensis]|uniref:sensor histidine kinase n=1 Tax=Paucilactobacillus nenjiangensis TaxID=1296540 RepID=UPI003BB16B08
MIWLSPRIVAVAPKTLIFGQLIPTLIINFLVNGIFIVNMIGLFTILLIESIVIFSRLRKISISIICIYSALIVSYALLSSTIRGLLVLQSLIFMGIAAWYFYRIYQKAVEERNRAEDLVDELKVAYSQIEEVTVKAERQRIARNLHDTLTQELAGISLQLSAAVKNLDKGNLTAVREILTETSAASRSSLKESRELLSELCTIQYDNLSDRLAMLFDAFQKGHQLKIQNSLKDVPEYSQEQMTEIVRIVVEALNNVEKHTDAKEVIIRSDIKDAMFVLQIIDFGAGFSLEKPNLKGHYGMQGMQERAISLGGTLDVTSVVNEGTTVTLKIPTVRKETL